MPARVSSPRHIERTSHPTRLSIVAGLLGPEAPGDDDEELEHDGRPQRAGQTDLAVGPDAADHRADEQEQGGGRASVALDILREPGEEIGVGEEIAVDGRQDDAGQGAELQDAADDRLAAGLEGDEGDGHGDPDGDGARGARRGAEGDHEGGDDDEQQLQGVGGDDDPALAAAEAAVVAREEGAPQAEGDDGGAGADPAVALRRRDDAQADVDGVACGGENGWWMWTCARGGRWT